jgi:uncharacterized protein (TIGR00290 family)
MPSLGKALCSWSGGKDSCLALHLAIESGAPVTTLLSVFEEQEDRNRSHAMPMRLLQAQAEAMGMSLVTPRASWKTYESEFVSALKACRETGVESAVFGDIDLVPHREWEEKVCVAAGMCAHLPLWGWPRDKVVDAIFERNIKAICVCVNAGMLAREFCGRSYDRHFIEDLPPHVDACGENGEFHTFVMSAPLFRFPVDVGCKGLRRYVGPAEYGSQEFYFADLT